MFLNALLVAVNGKNGMHNLYHDMPQNGRMSFVRKSCINGVNLREIRTFKEF